jgi:hypothetical protein
MRKDNFTGTCTAACHADCYEGLSTCFLEFIDKYEAIAPNMTLDKSSGFLSNATIQLIKNNLTFTNMRFCESKTYGTYSCKLDSIHNSQMLQYMPFMTGKIHFI